MMIELRIEGQLADLPPDVRIRLQISSPLFGDDFAGDLSFPFNLPVTDVNAAIFGYAHYPNASANRRKEYVASITCGPLERQGTLQLRNFDDRKYQVNLIVPPGNIPRKTWETKLKYLDFGKQSFPTVLKKTFHFVTSTEGLGLGGLRRIKIYNYENIAFEKGYEGVDLAGISLDEIMQDMVNEFNSKNEDKKSKVYGMTASFVNNQFIINSNPMDHLIKIRFEFSGRNTIELPFTHIQYATWVNYQFGSTNLLLEDDRYVLPMVKNAGWYDPSDNPQFIGYVNFFAAGSYRFNDDTLRTQYSLVPYLRLPWVIKQLAKILGYTFQDDFFTGDLADLVIGNNQSIDEQVPGLNIPFNQYKSTINFADHLPDMNPKEFLKFLGNAFGFRPVFNVTLRTLRFVKLNPIPGAATTKEWSAKMIRTYQGDVQELEPNQLKFQLDSADEYSKIDLTKPETTDPVLKTQNSLFRSYPDVAEGVKVNSIETPFAPILQLKTITTGSRSSPSLTLISPPMLKQKAVSPLFGQKDEKPAAPRLGFFQKKITLTENYVNDATPRGGTIGYKDVPSLTYETENYSLVWVAEKGLVNSFWRNWLALLDQTYPLKRNMLLNLLDVASLVNHPEEKIHLDGMEYLPALVDVELGLNGIIGTCQITWYRV